MGEFSHWWQRLWTRSLYFLHASCLAFLYVQITTGAVSNSLDVKITAIEVCNFWPQDPRVVISEWIKRTTFNVISKRLSKGLAIVCTRRGLCQSVRDCFDVSGCLSVASAWFGQTLSQWRCRRESIFNHPPITYTGINEPQTHVGWQFCFFHKTALPFFVSCMIVLRFFLVDRRYCFFLVCQIRY
jgi:hypothetical protein